jgi:hypothetical protein
MSITQAMCTSFKKELLEAKHNFLNSGGSTFKLALYTSSASLDATTTAYTTSNEVSGTGYSAKGNTLLEIPLCVFLILEAINQVPLGTSLFSFQQLVQQRR